MKATLAAIAAFFSLIIPEALAATNLIENGSFNGGVLAPWIASETVTSLPGECVLGDATHDGQITQEITAAGQKAYYVSLKVTNVRSDRVPHLSILADRSNGTLAGDFVPLVVDRNYYAFVVQFYSSPIARLRIIGGGVSISEVSVVELDPSPLAGAYVGTAKVTVGVGEQEARVESSKMQRLKARVFANGEFVILRDAEHVAAGVLFSDNTFILNRNGERVTGMASVKNKRIEFSVSELVSPLQFKVPYGVHKTTDFALTRTGK